MALQASDMYNRAVIYPHGRATKVRVFHGGEDVTPAGGLPIVTGSVTAALNSRVTRSLTLEVPHEFYPHNPTDLLSPYRAVVQVESGIRYPDGSTETFPVFTGRIYQADLRPDGGVQLRADDLAADVIDYRFEQPQASRAFFSVTQQIQLLISQAIDSPSFGVNDVEDSIVPELVWDDDRGRALDDLASSLQARWYTLGNGDFVVRRYPYVAGQPVANLQDGPQGIVTGATKTITRDSMANSVTVVSERVDGSEPIRVTRRDNVPSSPTFFEGLFGKVSQVIKPQTPITFAQAYELAQRSLDASLALTEQWTVDAVPVHWLEPGDTVRISYRGVEATQVIDTIRLPLGVDGAMSLQTRASQLAPSPDTESV